MNSISEIYLLLLKIAVEEKFTSPFPNITISVIYWQFYSWVNTKKDMYFCLRENTLATYSQSINNWLKQWNRYILTDMEQRSELKPYLVGGHGCHCIIALAKSNKRKWKTEIHILSL